MTLTKKAIDHKALRAFIGSLAVGESRLLPIVGVRPTSVYCAVSRAKKALGYEVTTSTDDAMCITVTRTA